MLSVLRIGLVQFRSWENTFCARLPFQYLGSDHFFIPPANEVAGVYSDPYVRPFVRSFVRSFVRPSPQSLIRYFSKTTEQNFMKLSGIVHYMMPYCTSYFKILSAWFWGFPEQNKNFAITTYGEGGPISNPLLLYDRWTEFHETFRDCSLHDAILHLLF